MSQATTIAAGTYPVGDYPLGPVSLAAGVSQIQMTLDTSNYDALPSPVLTLTAELSQDSGVTWESLPPVSWQGPNGQRNGSFAHTTSFLTALPGASPAGNKWRVRGNVNVSGQDYIAATAGTIVMN